MQQVAHKNTQIKGNLHEKTETLKRGRDEDYPIGEFQAALSILPAVTPLSTEAKSGGCWGHTPCPAASRARLTSCHASGVS